MTATIEDPVARAAATTARMRAAVEAQDPDAFAATLAPGAVLHSPITDRVTFRGADELRWLMGCVFACIAETRYRHDIGDATTRVLTLDARTARGRALQETVVVTLDGDARITDLRLFIRPMPGLAALMAELGPLVAARHGRARAALVGAMLRPYAALARSGDALGVRLSV